MPQGTRPTVDVFEPQKGRIKSALPHPSGKEARPETLFIRRVGLRGP